MALQEREDKEMQRRQQELEKLRLDTDDAATSTEGVRTAPAQTS